MQTTYALNDRVEITYRNFDMVTDAFLGYVTESGTVTRLWSDGKTISIRTDSGKLFMRNFKSSEVRKG